MTFSNLPQSEKSSNIPFEFQRDLKVNGVQGDYFNAKRKKRLEGSQPAMPEFKRDPNYKYITRVTSDEDLERYSD